MSVRKKRSVPEPISFFDSLSASSGAASNKNTSIHITGQEDLASSIKNQKENLDAGKEQFDKDKSELVNTCKQVRLEMERKGDLYTTLKIDTNDCDSSGNPAYITSVFQDKYSYLTSTPEVEKSLSDTLGEHMDALISRKLTLKVNDDVTLTELEEVLGKRAFGKLMSLVSSKEELTLKKGFLKARHALRPEMDDVTNHKIDSLAEGLRSSPMIRVK